MPDDIVSFGASRGGADGGPGADEVIWSLFLASYEDLVRMAGQVTGDRAAAERVVVLAYLELWRDLGRRGSAGPAAERLRLTVSRLAEGERAARDGAGPDRTGGTGPGGADPGEPGQSPADDPGRPDQQRAWAELTGQRAGYLARRRRRSRRGGTALAAVALAAVAATAVVRLDAQSPVSPGDAPGATVRPSLPRLYPAALVARIPLSGVINLAGDRATVWVIRARPPGVGPTTYQLVRINVATGKTGWRRPLGTHPPQAIAAGPGGVWLTTGLGEAGGQIERLDPRTGRRAGILHLPAGPCSALVLLPGRLVTQCTTRSGAATVFLMVSPVTGRIEWRAGPVTSRFFEIAAGPRSIWYNADYSGTYGLIRTANGGSRAVTVYQNQAPLNFAYTTSMVYSEGHVWALNSDENVAEIDPATGQVVRSYSSRRYDPARTGGLNYFTVSSGSLWFLDDGYPFSGVLRVSIATGAQVGGIPGIPPGSCTTVCSQIYATPGSIWVPTQASLLRIDPTRAGS